MRIGYARVSTEDQTLDLQKDALSRASAVRVTRIRPPGRTPHARIWKPASRACAKGTLVVWRLDRLGRNLADLVRLVGELEQRKVNFESLTEKIETKSPTGRLDDSRLVDQIRPT
jgi:DNA invertase Pin-like site-specific DNA recombinase